MSEHNSSQNLEQLSARTETNTQNQADFSALVWQDMQSSDSRRGSGGSQSDITAKLGLGDASQLLVSADKPSEIKRGIDEPDTKDIKTPEQLGKDFESAYQNHLKGKQPNLLSKDLRDDLKLAVQEAYKTGGAAAVKELSREINANIPGKDHGLQIQEGKNSASIQFVEKTGNRLKAVAPGMIIDAYPEQHKTAHDLASTIGKVGIEGKEQKKTLHDAFQAEYDKAGSHKLGVERMEALAQDIRNRLRGDFEGSNFNTGGSISYRPARLLARQQYINLDVKTQDK
jgi:hypothetical protein